MDERQLCFRLLGSNALITSVPIKAYLDLVLPVTLCGADNRYTLLQSCVAAKLGLPRNCQVTIHYNGMRLTPDVLLGAYSQSADNYHHYKLLAAKLVKEAWQCFEAQLKTAATGDLELNVTRCSDADIDAAQLLAQKNSVTFRSWWFNQQAEMATGVDNLLKRYGNNTAFMINVMMQWYNNDVYEVVSPLMQRNELFAAAAIAINPGNAKLISPQLWNSASFVVRSATRSVSVRPRFYTATFQDYIGDDVRKDAPSMLRLIKEDWIYFNVAAANSDFAFICDAVSSNVAVFDRCLTTAQQENVAKALPDNEEVQRRIKE